jgi:hypothetical protein
VQQSSVGDGGSARNLLIDDFERPKLRQSRDATAAPFPSPVGVKCCGTGVLYDELGLFFDSTVGKLDLHVGCIELDACTRTVGVNGD